MCWHALYPVTEAGHSPHLGSAQATGLRKKQMEEVSQATQGLSLQLETVMCATTRIRMNITSPRGRERLKDTILKIQLWIL